MSWINDLKPGDTVWQLELHHSFQDGCARWKATIVSVETNYIETVYERDYNCQWLLELCKGLAPNHRTFNKTWIKNYFAPDDSINIEQWTQ